MQPIYGKEFLLKITKYQSIGAPGQGRPQPTGSLPRGWRGRGSFERAKPQPERKRGHISGLSKESVREKIGERRRNPPRKKSVNFFLSSSSLITNFTGRKKNGENYSITKKGYKEYAYIIVE